MEKLRLFKSGTALIMAIAILFSSCSSTTTIKSSPDNAKLYLNDEYVGTTPYKHTDTKVLGSVTHIRIEKNGYETFTTIMVKDEEVNPGAIVGGLFLLFPFIWTLEYKPNHFYELKEVGNYVEKQNPTKKIVEFNKTKAERLREMKKLFDEGVLTEEEYEIEKAKILAEEKKIR